MSTRVTCPAGHEFELEPDVLPADRRCPVCGRAVTERAVSGGVGEAKLGKGLWQLMGRVGAPPVTPHVTDQIETSPADVAAAGDAPEASGSAPVHRGLWDLMGRREVAERETGPVVEATPLLHRDADAPVLPQQSQGDDLDSPVIADSDREPLQPQSLGLEDFVGGVRGVRRETRVGWGIISFVLGLLSLPLSIPALFHQSPLVFVPSGVLGFAALCFGLTTINAIRRGRVLAKGRAFALIGMVVGVIAMFLGPVVLSGVGRRMAAESRRSFTEEHLRQVGAGLLAYHDAQGMFPPGGVFKPIAGGTEQGLHGWMTMLLPFLGEQELFNRIDLQKPFSDEANLPAMGTDLPMFWSAGGDRSKVAGKFGVAHFAGVGGEFINEDGEQVEAGIFETNSEITRDLVTDGLSHTIVAGEVPARFPAWGDPENWRQVGRGLNQDPDGFGNVEGTGATFLMGDGSVRFVSRQASRRVLEALSTRSSGDE